RWSLSRWSIHCFTPTQLHLAMLHDMADRNPYHLNGDKRIPIDRGQATDDFQSINRQTMLDPFKRLAESLVSVYLDC
ncbi:MAG: hypothetical protein V2I40_14805, partial [Desulfobacteraceae bacterium]|nr:hypothetical protein [Desulfobacteraceae bacterium]